MGHDVYQVHRVSVARRCRAHGVCRRGPGTSGNNSPDCLESAKYEQKDKMPCYSSHSTPLSFSVTSSIPAGTARLTNERTRFTALTRAPWEPPGLPSLGAVQSAPQRVGPKLCRQTLSRLPRCSTVSMGWDTVGMVVPYLPYSFNEIQMCSKFDAYLRS